MTSTTAHADGMMIPDRVREVAAMATEAIRQELGLETRIRWFGSWPRGDARPHSDIDLAVSRPQPIDPVEMARARQRLEELPTLYSVDLVDLGEAGEILKREAEEEGIPL